MMHLNVLTLDQIRGPQTENDWDKHCEHTYRRGFWDGYEMARQFVDEAKSQGYGRPAEISNMMWAWSMDVLLAWKISSCKLEIPPPIQACKASWWSMRDEIIERDGGKCLFCGCKERLEVDHILPVADGGLPDPSNLRTLCRKCHRGGAA